MWLTWLINVVQCSTRILANVVFDSPDERVDYSIIERFRRDAKGFCITNRDVNFNSRVKGSTTATNIWKEPRFPWEPPTYCFRLSADKIRSRRDTVIAPIIYTWTILVAEEFLFGGLYVVLNVGERIYRLHVDVRIIWIEMRGLFERVDVS